MKQGWKGESQEDKVLGFFHLKQKEGEMMMAKGMCKNYIYDDLEEVVIDKELEEYNCVELFRILMKGYVDLEGCTPKEAFEGGYKYFTKGESALIEEINWVWDMLGK